METVEWEDVQRLVLSGYKKLPCSAYLLWRFHREDSTARKRWLAAVTDRLSRANAEHSEDTPDEVPASRESSNAVSGNTQRAINLALTASGLDRLGIGPSALDAFASEFLEGMSPEPTAGTGPRRSNVLGDLGASSPQDWEWGGWEKNRDIDGLLLLFAADETALQHLIEAETRAMADVAQLIPVELRGKLNEDRTEPFGFVDGISQPKIEGQPKRKAHKHSDKTQEEMLERISLVKPGEFLLGYLNERKERINPIRHANGSNSMAARDLRRNGTYLVFRQLEQDVAAFNEFVSSAAECFGETNDWVRARLLGRLPDGKSLVQDDSDHVRNDFLYYYKDRFGLACPIGAHVRRANPRDSLGPDPDTALRLSKMHRIIRRGRPYERRAADKEGADGQRTEKGMLFIALNADIAGQFEMIQHSWLNNPHFNGLYSGTDPISHYADQGGHITIQSRPTNLHIKRPAPFVRVRGGAYFFLPGIRALRQIAPSA
jgi:Dyp-type peroxidase family